MCSEMWRNIFACIRIIKRNFFDNDVYEEPFLKIIN